MSTTIKYIIEKNKTQFDKRKEEGRGGGGGECVFGVCVCGGGGGLFVVGILLLGGGGNTHAKEQRPNRV